MTEPPAAGNGAPQRIVSLISSATEIVCELGFGQQLVGRSHECDYPSAVTALPACSTSKVALEAASRTIDEQVRTIVADGLSVYRVDPELLDRLAPTVIVTQTQCEVCAVSLKDVEDAVCRLVGSRPRIVSLEPMSLSDIWKDIRTVASALGDAARGDALVSRLTERLAAVRDAVDAAPSRPSLACIEWIDPLMGAANWVPELVDCAGGADLFRAAGQHSRYLRMEQLVDADPDVIAVMPCGFDIERSCREMAPLAAHPDWARLSAVRNGRVVMVDGNQYFNRPGSRLVESAEILAECLHPGRCVELTPRMPWACAAAAGTFLYRPGTRLRPWGSATQNHRHRCMPTHADRDTAGRRRGARLSSRSSGLPSKSLTLRKTCSMLFIRRPKDNSSRARSTMNPTDTSNGAPAAARRSYAQRYPDCSAPGSSSKQA